MNSPVLPWVGTILAGAVCGGLLGWFGQCSSGACPLTSTWWRGALYGAFIATMLVLSTRS